MVGAVFQLKPARNRIPSINSEVCILEMEPPTRCYAKACTWRTHLVDAFGTKVVAVIDANRVSVGASVSDEHSKDFLGVIQAHTDQVYCVWRICQLTPNFNPLTAPCFGTQSSLSSVTLDGPVTKECDDPEYPEAIVCPGGLKCTLGKSAGAAVTACLGAAGVTSLICWSTAGVGIAITGGAAGAFGAPLCLGLDAAACGLGLAVSMAYSCTPV